jgi:hypothetical protein
MSRITAIACQPRRVLRAHPAVLALCVFLVGFALVWAGFSPLSEDPFLFCPGAPPVEGTDLDAEPALWPPGTTQCEYTTASGRSDRIHTPWRDWVVLSLVAAAVGVAVARRLALAAGLVVAAFVAAFL